MKMMGKIHGYVKGGMKPKMAIAKSLADSYMEKKKMAKGGMVKAGDYDLDEEHERSLGELMLEGDQPPVANPETQDMQRMLASKLHEENESMEYLAMGGLVEGMAGDETPQVMHDGSEEPMSDEDGVTAEEEHSEIKGVPMSMGLSAEAKAALEKKKKMRRFMR